MGNSDQKTKGEEVYTVKVMVSILAISYFAGALLLFVFQRSLLYHPAPNYDHDLETNVIEVQGERLNVLVLNAGQNDAVIYFGGNAEPVIFNAVPFAEHFSTHTVYLVNYRGYGGSSGSPSEAALTSDALAIYDQIRLKHERVAVIGRSLGSGVATYLAANRSVAALILVTPFDSILNVAQRRFAIYPLSWLLLDHYDSIGRASEISARTMIIIAEQDVIIPAEHALALANAFKKEQISTMVIEGADHNNISANPNYYRIIKTFLGKAGTDSSTQN